MPDRVRLVAPVYAAATPAGTRMLTHRGPLSMSASSFAMWFDQLAPALDGRHSLTELTGTLPADRAAMVERVVRLLIDRGLAREEDADAADVAGTDSLTAFADTFVAEAVRRVEAWRASELVIVGAGDLLDAAVRAARQTGMRRVRTAVNDDEPLGSADLVVDVGGAGGTGGTGGTGSLDVLRRIERDCDRRSVPLAQARILGEGIWLACSPVGQAVRRGLGSAARRIEGMKGGQGMQGMENVSERSIDPQVGELAATVAAIALIHQLFHTVACDAPATGPTVIDPATLAAERRRVLPHPFDSPLPSCTPGPPTPSQDEETFSRLAIAAVDAAAGLMGELTEADLCQTPLHVCQVRVADPVGLLGPAAPRPLVTGVGLDFGTARRQAARRALAVYGSLMIDPRRLSGIDLGEDPLAGDDPERILRRLRGGEPARLTGTRLDDGQIVEVDATLAFPALLGSSEPYIPPVGVAAGPGWDEAVCQGLLAHCRELVVSSSASLAPRRVDIAELEAGMLDAVGERYLGILAALGEPVEVYDLGVFAAVPAFAFCLAGRTVAYHCGRTAAEAVRQGLESLLLDHQSRASGQPEYLPAPVPPLPLPGEGPAAQGPAAQNGAAGMAARSPAGLADLVAVLIGRGLVPVAVPLDHDPESTAILPGLVHVVVTGG